MRELILTIQVIGMLIPMVGIIVLIYKEQGKTSLFLMLCNIGCFLMNSGYYLLLRTHSTEVAELAYIIEYYGNIVFYIFFMLFVLSYLHVRYPKWMTYMCGVFEFADMILLMGFSGNGLIFKRLDFVVYAELGVQTVDLVPGTFFKIRYTLICALLFVGVLYMCIKCFVVESREERLNLTRLMGAGFVVMLSLVLMLIFGFAYDIVPIFASLAIFVIIVSVIHGEMFRVTDSGRDWVFEHIDNAFVIVDSAYGYLESNAAARKIFADLEHKIKNRRISDELYGIMTSADDEVQLADRFYEKKVVDLMDEKGEVQGYSLILVDDTEHYHLMEELKDAKERAEDANKAKSNFMSNMSHEIRTPMNAIVGMTEILMRSDLPPKEKEYLSNIQNSGNALLKIINDILDFSKIEAGKLEVIEDSYEPMSMLSDLGMICLNRIGSKDVELLFDIDPQLPSRLYGDELRIRQVIINIMNNAIKFTDSGYVMLTIKVVDEETAGTRVDEETAGTRVDEETAGTRVDEETAGTCGNGASGIGIFISVKDTGQGIASDDLEKLFGSFQQVDTKRNRYKEGTGLGLAISQQLVNMMGGNIEVTSEYGKGSEFSFTIRQGVVDEAPAAAIKQEHKEDLVLFRFENSLVEAQARKLALGYLVRVLEDADLAGLKATGADALKAIFTDDPDMFTNEEKKEIANRNIVFYVLRNPMTDSVWNSDEVSLNKPLYSLNFCQGINRETAAAVVEREEDLNFTAPLAKLLIVDDNEMNLKVAKGLLEPLQVNIDTAANGKQAVGMVANKRYDIVFMDHMMPVMDGVEATRAIRQIGGDYCTSVPIVALSANATTEAGDMFVKEGLDDFVAKPIQMKDICRCILRWLPRELVVKNSSPAGLRDGLTAEAGSLRDGATSEVSSLQDGATGMTGGLQDGEIRKQDGVNGTPATEREKSWLEEPPVIGDLDVSEGLKNCGTQKLYVSLLGDFYKLIDAKCTKLDKCLSDNMLKDYTIEVHALKNTARMIGAMELSGMFYKMEQLGNAGDIETIQKLHPALMERYAGYKQVLLDYAFDAGRDREKVSNDVIKAALVELHDAMDAFDLDGADAAMKKIEGYALPKEMQEKLGQLSAYVADVAMEDVMRLAEEMCGMLE